MSNRRGRTGQGRAELALVGRGMPGEVPAPSAPAATTSCYVALGPLRQALDAVEWAPLRLATRRPARPASPRLPHALALHLAHAVRQAGDEAATVRDAVTPDRPRLAALLGSDVALVDGGLAALTQAGVVRLAERGGEVGAAVSFAPAVLGPPPRCAALDWVALATVTAGSPSAWVAAHALAERLERRHWTPVPRADLEQTLGAGASGARGALERLVAAGVVERREQRGGVSVYRFADALWNDGAAAALGAGVPNASPRPAAQPRGWAGPAAGHPGASGVHAPIVERPVASPAPGPLPSTGLRLVVGGVEVEVPAGMRARVDVDADGRPTLTLLGPGAPA